MSMVQHVCKKCDARCEIKVSRTAKNPGRKFWSCPRRCADTWNGWLTAEQDKAANSSSPPLSSSVPSATKRKIIVRKRPRPPAATSSTTHSSLSTSAAKRLSRTFDAKKKRCGGVSKSCARCKKQVDLDQEVVKMISRYTESTPFAAALRADIRRELKETFDDDDADYTCELCLYPSRR